jgi:rod shape-determining protein MreC
MVLVLSALMLMAVDYRNPEALRPVRTAAYMLALPLLVSVDSPHRFFNRTSGFFSSQSKLVMENSALKEQVQLYAAQQRVSSSLQQENQHLRAMLNAAPSASYTFTLAETLEAANDRVQCVVVLNKGANDLVYQGQVVLSGENIYGQIIEVTPFSAKVIQLIDNNHTIPVRNQRTGERALASGMGRGQPMEIKNLPSNSQTKEGDTFVSSGLGGIFPPDFPVAKVMPQGVEFKQGASFATVKASPLVNYEATRDVLLIWRKPGVPDPQPHIEAPAVSPPQNANTKETGKNKPASTKKEGSH